MLAEDKSRLTLASCAVYSVTFTLPLSSTCGVKINALLKPLTVSPQLFKTSAFFVPLIATTELDFKILLTAIYTFSVFIFLFSVSVLSST